MINSTPASDPAPPAPRNWGRRLWRRFPVVPALVLLASVGWSRWADWKRNELSELLDRPDAVADGRFRLKPAG